MSGQDFEQLTLFQEDSPASLFPWLESKKAKGMTVTCGRKCSELSENLRRVGLSVKTFLESCELPPGTWSRTWSVKDMTWRCLILKLRLSERRTDGKGSGSLPTPTTRDYKDGTAKSCQNVPANGLLGRTVHMFPTPIRSDATCGDLKGKEYTGTKHAMKLIQAAKMYPTPTTGAGMCGGSGNYNQLKALEDAGKITPEERRSMAAGNGGQLNPDWVEAMMGFPAGWTALEPDGATGAGSTESPESPPESPTE